MARCTADGPLLLLGFLVDGLLGFLVDGLLRFLVGGLLGFLVDGREELTVGLVRPATLPAASMYVCMYVCMYAFLCVWVGAGLPPICSLPQSPPRPIHIHSQLLTHSLTTQVYRSTV